MFYSTINRVISKYSLALNALNSVYEEGREVMIYDRTIVVRSINDLLEIQKKIMFDECAVQQNFLTALLLELVVLFLSVSCQFKQYFCNFLYVFCQQL